VQHFDVGGYAHSETTIVYGSESWRKRKLKASCRNPHCSISVRQRSGGYSCELRPRKAKVQTEVFDKWQETNKHWLDRISTEANLTSELASNLASARSVPDAIMACHKWNSRRLRMMAEDGQHLIADAQKFAEMGARLLSNGWQPKNSSAST
jgi:hypothetical protein